ncbi:hypothetical protein CORC01_00471 [Colletotrichum orchidophilum]|uniref:Uncharacterized protein n=1 Tax=Colletotrichum orchidophilum TaxID=1209926 RepID=A0A1G4BRP9_9PEZI|nr:uncharacterized protein CORC01_00471 [Colletotrichum orchidophilum]OHF04132.1 hypothetical protein CORC01_00471 [Colletotrichum orchidophilum]
MPNIMMGRLWLDWLKKPSQRSRHAMRLFRLVGVGLLRRSHKTCGKRALKGFWWTMSMLASWDCWYRMDCLDLRLGRAHAAMGSFEEDWMARFWDQNREITLDF